MNAVNSREEMIQKLKLGFSDKCPVLPANDGEDGDIGHGKILNKGLNEFNFM